MSDVYRVAFVNDSVADINADLFEVHHDADSKYVYVLKEQQEDGTTVPVFVALEDHVKCVFKMANAVPPPQLLPTSS